MKTKENKFCNDCKNYKKYYKIVGGSLHNAGCGKCLLPSKFGETLNDYECCEKWEIKEIPQSFDAKSIANEIYEIVARLNAILNELKKIPKKTSLQTQ